MDKTESSWSSRVTEKIIQSDDEEELRKRGYLLGKTLGEGSYAKVSQIWRPSMWFDIAIAISNTCQDQPGNT